LLIRYGYMIPIRFFAFVIIVALLLFVTRTKAKKNTPKTSYDTYNADTDKIIFKGNPVKKADIPIEKRGWVPPLCFLFFLGYLICSFGLYYKYHRIYEGNPFEISKKFFVIVFAYPGWFILGILAVFFVLIGVYIYISFSHPSKVKKKIRKKYIKSYKSQKGDKI